VKLVIRSVNSTHRIHRRQHSSTDDTGMSKHRLSPYNAYYHNWLTFNLTASDSSSDERCFLEVLIVAQMTGSIFQFSTENYGRRCLTPLSSHYYNLSIINKHYYFDFNATLRRITFSHTLPVPVKPALKSKTTSWVITPMFIKSVHKSINSRLISLHHLIW